jgi:hypothetical protein
VGADHISDVARDAGLGEVETWTVEGRWFASINRVSLPLDEPPTEPTESEMLSL